MAANLNLTLSLISSSTNSTRRLRHQSITVNTLSKTAQVMLQTTIPLPMLHLITHLTMTTIPPLRADMHILNHHIEPRRFQVPALTHFALSKCTTSVILQTLRFQKISGNNSSATSKGMFFSSLHHLWMFSLLQNLAPRLAIRQDILPRNFDVRWR